MTQDLDREQWTQLAKANAEVIRGEMDKLKGLLKGEPPILFAEFWAQAREITSMFKSFKPLEAETRETLWAEFHEVCEATHKLQEGDRSRRREASTQCRETIMEIGRAHV